MAMKEGLIGRKKGMTQVFGEDGNLIPVTVVEAGPCTVVGVAHQGDPRLRRAPARLRAAQEERHQGDGRRSTRRRASPRPMRVLREIRLQKTEAVERLPGRPDPHRGAVQRRASSWTWWASTKGKGFQGGVQAPRLVRRRRDPRLDVPPGAGLDRRLLGSVARLAGPHLPGRMGGDRRTVLNLVVVRVIPEQNLILLRGAVPGAHRRPRGGPQEREADQGAAAEGARGQVAMPSVPVVDANGKAQHARAVRRRVRRHPCACRCCTRRW